MNLTVETRVRTSRASCGHIVKAGEKYMSSPDGSYGGRQEYKTHCAKCAHKFFKTHLKKMLTDLKALGVDKHI